MDPGVIPRDSWHHGGVSQLAAVPQGPLIVRVGRAEAVFWPGQGALATALAEVADRAGPWPGLPDSVRPFVRIIVARSAREFDSLTGGRLPAWGAGAAFPTAGTVVVQARENPVRVLRHELAHVALHTVVRRVPLWFDEGYAARASGEWSRLEALRVNWAVAGGRVPTLRHLTAELRGGAARAEAAYALATTAVLLLERLGGERGLAPLVQSLAVTGDLDRALRATYQLSLDQFELRWHQDLRARYGWITLLGSVSGLWAVVLVLVGGLWVRRRRRDAERRKALDDGWAQVLDGHAPEG
jgi:MYXO-CTERM domain-containing protein